MSNASHALVDPGQAFEEPFHESRVLRLFSERLNQCQAPLVLDMGPTFGDNIHFFATKAKKLFICDMFVHLDEMSRSRLPAKKAFQYLVYPPGHFDGILLWNLIDYLDTENASELVRLVHKIVKPRGMVVLLAQDLHKPSGVPIAFSIRDECRLHPQPLSALNLQANYRQTREILDMMNPFTAVKSFICRNGVREYLLARP